MDCRFTTQSVKINKTVYRQTVEHPYDAEIVLPDYYPDIHRVLKCRVNTNVAQRSVENGRIIIDGIICLNLIYCDKDCGIRSFDVQTPFTKTVDCSLENGNYHIDVKCRTDYCNCRASSERQIDVHAAVSLSLCAVLCEEKSVVADIDSPHVQIKRSVSPASSPKGSAEKYLLINDEVSLPDRCPAIRNILRNDLSVVINDRKIVGNKVVVRGEIILNVLYFGEETADCEHFCDSIPFSQIVEVQGINDDCTCTVHGEIVSAELMPRTGMSGDMRVVSASVKLLLSVSAFCEEEIPYLTDAYSTKYDLKLDWDDVCFEKVVNTISENLKSKHTLDVPVTDEMQIVDLWCKPYVTKAAAINGAVNASGEIQVCMIVRDKHGEPSYYERVFDFGEKYDVTLPEKCDIKCTASAVGCTAAVTDNAVEVTAENHIEIDVIEQTQCKVISAAELGEEHNRICKPSSVVVYFAVKGDSVWDIARRYHTSPDAISITNAINNDIIDRDMTLVIPSS